MYDLSTNKCLDKLLTALGLTPEELTPDELKSITWLAGWDWQCIDTLEHVFKSHTEKRGPGLTPWASGLSVDFTLNTQEVQEVLDKLRFAGYYSLCIVCIIHNKYKTYNKNTGENMERKDYLKTWDYLQTLKDILEQKAKDVAARGGDNNALATGRYLQECSEIRVMQEKIDKEMEGLS